MKSKVKQEGGLALSMVWLDEQGKGRRRYEYFNWIGQVYRIPRFWADKCDDLYEFRKSGAYILLAKEEGRSKIKVYIGKAEEVRFRLRRHVSEKFLWEEALVIISQNDHFNYAHAGYLERRLYEMARQARLCVLQNRIKPPKNTLSGHEKAAMEEFIRQLKFVLLSADVKILGEDDDEEEEMPLFHLQAVRGADADGYQVTEGFKVLKGSCVGNPLTPSCSEGYRKIRDQLILDHVLEKQKDGRFLFVRDYVFKSPSAAASVVIGGNADGLERWKTGTGKTLKMLMKLGC